MPRIANAQAYPSRPVRLLVGFPPGGPNDILARLIGQWLTERLGAPFVVENLPGDAGNIATAAVVRAPADGHTLLLVGPSNAINGSLSDKLAFNFLRDIAPVAGLTRQPLVMLVHPAVSGHAPSYRSRVRRLRAGQVDRARRGRSLPFAPDRMWMTGKKRRHRFRICVRLFRCGLE